MASEAANIVELNICLEDQVLMSGGVNNNFGREINDALENSKRGQLIDTKYCDMWEGDVIPFIEFPKFV